MVFLVLPSVDEGAKSIVPDMMANQAAPDLTKEVTTDAPLESQGKAGALFSQGESLVFATARDEDTPTDPSEGPVFDSPGDDIGKDLWI